MKERFSVVVGLGNPGGQYDSTRHNIGFAVVDALRACSRVADPADLPALVARHAGSAIAGAFGASGWSERSGLREATCEIGGWTCALLKPMTFMNRSGEPLQTYLSYRKIPLSEVIVVHDEIDIPFGTVRLKIDGGEGGHNGLRSISEQCGGRGYARIRVGVGKPPQGSPLLAHPDGIATWVLSRFSAEQRLEAEQLVVRSACAVFELATKGLRAAQNRFN